MIFVSSSVGKYIFHPGKDRNAVCPSSLYRIERLNVFLDISTGTKNPGSLSRHLGVIVQSLVGADDKCPICFRVIEAYPAAPPMVGSPLGYNRLLGMYSHAFSKSGGIHHR
jgi:hypothetical protein